MKTFLMLLVAVSVVWGVAIKNATIQYSSTIDNITNLFANVCFDSTATVKAPIVVIMHAFSGNKSGITTEITNRIINSYGFFCVVPDMRGRGGSGGSPDCGAREIYDIYDAVSYVKANYLLFVDTSNIVIVGYSGGGGNVLSFIDKFPDIVVQAVDHFGISDYATWYVTNPDQHYNLETWIGGDTATYPTRYRARKTLSSIATTNVKLFMYHDTADGSVPVWQSDRVRDSLNSLSKTNFTYTRTNASSNPRAIHGYPIVGNPGEPNIQFEVTWASDIANNIGRDVSFTGSGSRSINGFIKTKRFKVFLSDAKNDAMLLKYNISSDSVSLKVVNNITQNSSVPVAITFNVDTSQYYIKSIDGVILSCSKPTADTIQYLDTLAANDSSYISIKKLSIAMVDSSTLALPLIIKGSYLKTRTGHVAAIPLSSIANSTVKNYINNHKFRITDPANDNTAIASYLDSSRTYLWFNINAVVGVNSIVLIQCGPLLNHTNSTAPFSTDSVVTSYDGLIDRTGNYNLSNTGVTFSGSEGTFNGTSSYLSNASAGAFNYNTAFSAVVIKESRSSNTGNKDIIGKKVNGGVANGWNFLWINNQLYVNLRNSSSYYLQAYVASDTIKSYQMRSLVYAGNSSYPLIYRNDTSQTLTNVNNTLGSNAITSTAPFTIGATAGAASFYAGKIDNVLLFNRVVSKDELTMFYNNFYKPDFFETGTLIQIKKSIATKKLNTGLSLAF